MSYAEAARETRRSESTVRSLLHTAYRRLGATTVAHALAICSNAGWLDDVPGDGIVVELSDRRVTWAQRLYLETFDQSLRAGDDPEEVERTRLLRQAALRGIHAKTDGRRPRGTFAGDPIGRIIGDLGHAGVREAS
jgi:hypothetical protein